MKVHFCDLCNESVPQRDLDQGRAFLRKGRVVCAACDVAMGADLGAGEDSAPAVEAAVSTPDPPDSEDAGPREDAGGSAEVEQPLAGGSAQNMAQVASAPRQPTSSAGVGLAMALASMGILLTSAVAVLVFERLDEASRNNREDVVDIRKDLSKDLGDIRNTLTKAGRQDEQDRRQIATELAAMSAREQERAHARGEESQRVARELADLAGAVDSNAAFGERIVAVEHDVSNLSGSVSEVRGDLGLIASKVVELEERPVVVAVEPPALEPDDEPAWMPLLADLASPSSGARWSAVQGLGDTGDPAVIPHLAGMLSDTDIFVRMATARVLGDLGAPAGIPALIDGLEDKEASVREASVVSLRSITGKNLKFDPTSGEGERAKKVKAWREWWRRNGEEDLGQA